ncbi:transcription factor E2F8-like [Acipenser ruthenus]|uniref:transcription factor E2F8-like n=1 Tax=Acipenser ruthenus TaxID=7906 RepID=UPI0027417939|nr:transcription factor E2F8-like [Acipenser ruthenus]XP_033913411.3 transcription factor E2F8-like [Acipenser ruthenus]
MTSGLLNLQYLTERPQSSKHDEEDKGSNQKENIFLEPHTRVMKTPLKPSTSHSILGEIQPDMGALTTPTKGNEAAPGEPWTPTANLKMLISAASPEIRNREKKLNTDENEATEATDCSQEHLSGDESDRLQPSRKEKSLGLLCHKFLARYPDYPNPALNNNVCLDEVAGELNVERRRIYDIVNVLESLHMVSRLAKNRYTWHGRSNLMQTLGTLKTVGDEHKYAEQMQQIKQRDSEKEFDSDNEEENEHLSKLRGTETELGHREMCFVELPGMEFRAASVNSRKDKSLRVMSQKFVMLFLVSKPRVVSLEVAAKILIGEDQVVDLDKSKFKTKIRRLYDIANVLSSLALIRKVHVTEERGRKPAFKWTGPEDFPDVKRTKRLTTPTSVTSGILAPRSSVDNCAKNLFPSSRTKQSFTRHPSLVKLAKSIEDDRRKINSAPSSPVKKIFGDFSDSDLHTSRMAQLAAICKVQLDEQSKQSKRKPKPHYAKPSQKTKGKAAKTTGHVESTLSSELGANSSSQTDLSVQAYSQAQYSPIIPVILPQNQTVAPYAIYLHSSSARPMANPSSFAVRSMTFGDNAAGSPADTNSENSLHSAPTGNKDSISSEKYEYDLSQKNVSSTNQRTTPDKGHKRVCTETFQENSFPKISKTQTNLEDTAEFNETYQARVKARRGLIASRPSPRALHLDPEFINTPEGKENKGSDNLGESVEKFLENEEKPSYSDSEAGLTPVRTVPMPAFTIPARLQPEALIPAGYLIPISHPSLFSCQRSKSPERKGETTSTPSHPAYQSPITGVIPVTSDFHHVTLTSTRSKIPVSQSAASIASFPLFSQASPSFASGCQVNGPSPGILNFTLQNLGLISPGIHPSVSPGTLTTPISPITGHLRFQQGGMIFVKPMSPLHVHNQIPGQPMTLISLQQPTVQTTPKGSQSAHNESFFHTPVSASSQLPAVVSTASRTPQENVYIPQRKLEVSTEDNS